MEPQVQAALIAGLVALVIAGLSNFGAESFKRHRDAVTLSAGLAGELRGYLPALDELVPNLEILRQRAAAGVRNPLTRFARPASPVFDGNVSKLGMLGVDLAERVSFVYSCIGAFRSLMEAAAAENSTPQEQEIAIAGALNLLKRLEPSKAIVDDLRAFVKREWLQPY